MRHQMTAGETLKAFCHSWFAQRDAQATSAFLAPDVDVYKRQLISHFNGINKPTKGRVYIAGEDLWADPAQIRKFRFMVGLVFQYPEYQLFEETVYKDIAFGPRNMGLDEAEVCLLYTSRCV